MSPGDDEHQNTIHFILSPRRGLGIAVVRGDGQGNWSVETKGYGIATANGSRVTENTLFPIGSNSKPLDFDLMSHRTGLPRHDRSYKWSDDTLTVIRKLKTQRPSAEFREVFQYNNLMYMVLSYLPTRLLPSKVPFARYVKQHIFDPLGLSSTTYSYDVAQLGHLANGMTRQGINYSANPFGGTPRALPFWSTTSGEDGNILSAPGGVISNAVDMATWLQTLLLNGIKPGTEDVIISRDILEKVSGGITVADPEAAFPELSPTVYGGGQARSSYRGHEIVEHDGGVPGFSSLVTRLPFDNLGLAILCNDNEYGGAIMSIIRYRLIDEALGLDKIDWEGRFKPFVTTLPPLATPPPINASLPSVSFPNLAGTYDDGGYGKFELCYVSPNKYPTQSRKCQDLSANLSTILPGAAVPGIPTFIAEWDSPWTSHTRLLHFDGNIFNVSLLSSFPTGNVSAPFWTYNGDTAFDAGTLAETVADGGHIGLALTGIWGAGAGVPRPQGNAPRERAEVFFDKL
ncbi:putative beta-lactamase [Lyophyllum shimeji]|uniref:Beta-lactamase n=1 Tax=Lyophyllum shimeji TaxID=47721 RepID=A0A9P3URA8_LYOSH|nr:putative beta-lactamase [Lyophyllum shimeji]